MNRLKVSIVQMFIEKDKIKNLEKANNFIKKSVKDEANMVVLPEMFLCPYIESNFPIYAEKEGDFSFSSLSEMAKKNNVYLVAGSVPEKDDEGHIYNTSYVFDPNGNKIAKHRKAHLFDIDIKGGQYLVDKGAMAIIVPAAFNMTTGPAHWELLFRCRAVDNQVYTIGCAPARDCNSSYISYGNSIAVSPYGQVLVNMNEKEGFSICDLDFEYVNKIRDELPLLAQRRLDIY